MRKTNGVIDRIESNGFGMVHETKSNKPRFFNNSTLVKGSFKELRRGSRVELEVDDRPDVMVVRSIYARR